jgi:hypothetical protein
VDWFMALLAITTAVRGLGAGIIYDVALVSLPVRRRIGAIRFAEYARANFEGRGVKTYATVSILGALLTIAVTAGAFAWGDSATVTWSVVVSFAATVLAFFGTLRALPALLSMRRTPGDEAALSKALDRFARWHTFSTAWQMAAFLALVVALANQQ